MRLATACSYGKCTALGTQPASEHGDDDDLWDCLPSVFGNAPFTATSSQDTLLLNGMMSTSPVFSSTVAAEQVFGQLLGNGADGPPLFPNGAMPNTFSPSFMQNRAAVDESRLDPSLTSTFQSIAQPAALQADPADHGRRVDHHAHEPPQALQSVLEQAHGQLHGAGILAQLASEPAVSETLDAGSYTASSTAPFPNDYNSQHPLSVQHSPAADDTLLYDDEVQAYSSSRHLSSSSSQAASPAPGAARDKRNSRGHGINNAERFRYMIRGLRNAGVGAVTWSFSSTKPTQKHFAAANMAALLRMLKLYEDVIKGNLLYPEPLETFAKGVDKHLITALEGLLSAEDFKWVEVLLDLLNKSKRRKQSAASKKQERRKRRKDGP